MSEIVSAVLLVIGASFLLVAAVGVVRMPDLFTRMQPATKAVTLGITCMLLAVAVYFGRIGVTTRALATVAFFFLTAPVTAHLIGRASYFVGVPLWDGTVIDELRGNYDPLTHACHAARAIDAEREVERSKSQALEA
ncbi:MAG: monovalent cation/H(+) antiporter subunit G [Chloroflexota bacterium]|nr:monovalent cation/H(+) antiporter subunit G [Chloroflexota bacterium]